MRMVIVGAFVAALAAAAGAAFAANGHSPYVGLEGRGIKALSPDETRGLLGGEGMALSLAAELNGYPGPRHVRELADQLKLTAEQRARAAALENEMKAEAIAVGREILALEGELDRAFRDRAADRGAIDRLSNEIAVKRGALRAVHLRAHLAMSDALRPEQRTLYMTLRGYDGKPGAPHGGSHHRKHH
jgi:Spy/CpxP family protein refolding chaperone